MVTTTKVIIGGVAPLFVPWAISKEGLLGGPLAVLFVGTLCAYTVRQLVEYKDAVVAETGRDDLTYVDIAGHAYGPVGSALVLVMTALNSLGIVAAYLGFIGPTLSTLSSSPTSMVSAFGIPDMTSEHFQLAAAALIVPLNSFAGNARFLSIAAYLGAAGVFAAVAFTCAYGFSVNPDVLASWSKLPLFTTPTQFFESSGVVTLLFAMHFAIFPIERAMRDREGFTQVVAKATWFTAAANVAFGCLGFAFFGTETSSVVLDNITSGTITELVRLFLVVDMIVSAPIVLS
eukprot:CAMPEP_0114108552 /NCGR_PEP_ID=MMETSP0043_2-20121206/289_1 /TAXON_ID=464988 /ORGANISM="Hemiselmis andersenii, Strain CCMP644" /LENGTH=288 /DNA_ID=CAMNT_0001200341 /DNA_START=89 /DNA_END=951 /DNA_ORIENTATION=+